MAEDNDIEKDTRYKQQEGYNVTNVLTSIKTGYDATTGAEGIISKSPTFALTRGIYHNPIREKINFINSMSKSITGGAKIVSEFWDKKQNNLALREFLDNEKGEIMGALIAKTKSDISSHYELLKLSRKISNINFVEEDENTVYSIVDRLHRLSSNISSGGDVFDFLENDDTNNYLDNIIREKAEKNLKILSDHMKNGKYDFAKGITSGIIAPALHVIDSLIDIPFNIVGEKNPQFFMKSFYDALGVDERTMGSKGFNRGNLVGNAAVALPAIASGGGLALAGFMSATYIGKPAISSLLGISDRTLDSMISLGIVYHGYNSSKNNNLRRNNNKSINPNTNGDIYNSERGYSIASKTDPYYEMARTIELEKTAGDYVVDNQFKEFQNNKFNNFHNLAEENPEGFIKASKEAVDFFKITDLNPSDVQKPHDISTTALLNKSIKNDVPIDISVIDDGDIGGIFASVSKADELKTNKDFISIQAQQNGVFAEAVTDSLFGEKLTGELLNSNSENIAVEAVDHFTNSVDRYFEKAYNEIDVLLKDIISGEVEKGRSNQKILKSKYTDVDKSVTKMFDNLQGKGRAKSDFNSLEKSYIDEAFNFALKKNVDVVKIYRGRMNAIINDLNSSATHETPYSILNDIKKDIGNLQKARSIDPVVHTSGVVRGLDIIRTSLKDEAIKACDTLEGNNSLSSTIKQVNNNFSNSAKSFEKIASKHFGKKKGSYMKMLKDSSDKTKKNFLDKSFSELEGFIKDNFVDLDSTNSSSDIIKGSSLTPNMSLLQSLNKYKNRKVYDFLKRNGLNIGSFKSEINLNKFSKMNISEFNKYANHSQKEILTQFLNLSNTWTKNQNNITKVNPNIAENFVNSSNTFARSKRRAFIKSVAYIIERLKGEKTISSGSGKSTKNIQLNAMASWILTDILRNSKK